MRHLILPLLACAAAVLPACGGLETSFEFDRNYNYSRLRTYNWKGVYGAPTDLLEASLQHELDRRLAELGLEKLESGLPDFRIAVFFDLPTEAWGGAAARRKPPQGSGITTAKRIAEATGQDPSSIEPGRRPPDRPPSLLFVFVDRITFVPLWSGFLVGEFGEAMSDAEQARAARAAVDLLLAEFPPGTGG